MANANARPDPFEQPDYKTWLHDVQSFLTAMDMELDAWEKNWDYDFRKEYDAGASALDAAVRAHDFWWQHVLEESWT